VPRQFAYCKRDVVVWKARAKLNSVSPDCTVYRIHPAYGPHGSAVRVIVGVRLGVAVNCVGGTNSSIPAMMVGIFTPSLAIQLPCTSCSTVVL
jgi:hypothetical protein